MADGGENISSRKSKKARKVAWSRSEYLSKAVYVKDEGEVLEIKSTDKLTILLKSKRVFVVFRQTDGAVAVLEDVAFQRARPRAMFNLCDHKGLGDAGMTLRYAVAKIDWSETKEKVTLHKGDIILTLADIHGHHVVGIKQTNNVEVFPSNVVNYLTKPRLILRDGKVIRMTSLYKSHTRQLFKSTGGLFGWKEMDGQPVLLDSYRETEGHTMNGNKEELYDPLPPLEKCIEKKREETNYANQNLTEKTEDKEDYEWSEDDGYSVAWGEDDNQGNDDYGYDRPMGTVMKGLLENSGTDFGNYEVPDFMEKTEHGECLGERPVQTHKRTSNEQIYFTEGAFSKPSERPVQTNRSTSYEPLRFTEGAYSKNERPVPPQRSTSNEQIHFTEGAFRELVEEVDHQPSENAEDGKVESLQSQIALYEHYSTTPALHQCIAEHLVDEKRDEFGRLLTVPKNLRLEIEERDDTVIDKTAKLLDLWHARNGSGATVAVLVRALLQLHLEESTLLLTDMLDMFKVDDAQSEA